MDVSVIIVSYNTKKLITECLNSIIKHSKIVKYEILVIDNASSDNSIDSIKQNFSQVRVFENSTNIGFGRACNIGIQNSYGKYVLFLNSDTIILNDVLNYFYIFMESYNLKNDIGALGSILLDNNLCPIHSYDKFPDFFQHIKKFFLPRNEEIKQYHSKGFNFFEVEYITGANLFIKKDTILELNGFDSDFFMYYEETDLQKRMSKKKLRRIIIEEPKIIHLQGKSFNNKNIINQKRLMQYNSMFLYFKKNTNLIQYLLIRISYLFFKFPLILLSNPFNRETTKLLKIFLFNKPYKKFG